MSGWEMAAWVIGALLVWAPCYAFACWFWPYAACRKCKGAGRFRSPSGKYWRHCRRCKGTGMRVRTGRRVWVYLAGKKNDAVG